MKITTSRKKERTRPRGYIETYRPSSKTVELLEDVEAVLAEYQDYWPLTARQIFYRLVGAFDYPKTENFYGNLSHHAANARRGRRIPFQAIRDDGVTTIALDHFDDEDHFHRHYREAAENFKLNKLDSQLRHVEVHCEASGMLPQLARVAERYSIRCFSSSGFDSLTAKKALADRICDIGKPAIILHLGDFDPSGVSIFNTMAEDVAAFVKADRPWPAVTARFRRVALTELQIARYKLPTAPAKKSDSRSASWRGDTCQLEALPPDTIAAILDAEIRRVLNKTLYDFDLVQEEIVRRNLAPALPPPEATQ